MEQDEQIAEAIERERPRLRSFIRKRVTIADEAEDILQDVFAELVEAYRSLETIEQTAAWLFRVARNRITDLFRKKKPEPFADGVEDLLPSPEAGPDAVFARGVLLRELEDALTELPSAQREVFLAHEIEGLSYQQIAERTGVSVNTLLSRKRYAVLHLRRRLESVYQENLK